MPATQEAITKLDNEAPGQFAWATALLRVSRIASELADSLTNNRSFGKYKLGRTLLEVAIELSGAEVATLCEVSYKQTVLIRDHLWRDGVQPVGKIPVTKHPGECVTTAERVNIRELTAEYLHAAKSRKKSDGTPWYDEGELRHFHWLKGEVRIPLLVSDGIAQYHLVLGSSQGSAQFEERRAVLELVRGMFQAIYELALYVDEQKSKEVLLQHVALVLPKMASADSNLAFYRAVCGLLTCGRGFAFGRAMFFELTNGDLPAACRMAIGGMLECNWPAQQDIISARLHTLANYIDDALSHPLPKSEATGEFDPLFSEVCIQAQPSYVQGQSAALDRLIETGKNDKGDHVLKLTASDPWIGELRQKYSRAFANPNDEFFVFLLKPHSVDGKSAPIGFVVADLPYQPYKHRPGPGFPDLAMTAFTLQLLAGLWRFRDDAQSYFHVLGAIPILRHQGGQLLHQIDEFVAALPKAELPPAAQARHKELVDTALEIARAREYVERMRDTRTAGDEVASLREFIDAYLGRAAALLESSAQSHRPAAKLTFNNEITPATDSNALIHPDDLEAILACLFGNFAVHGPTDAKPVVSCTIRLQRRTVQVGNGIKAERLLLSIQDDGAPIPVDLSPFLFSDGVSTNPQSGHGTGLKSARQVARSYGGDVVLLACNPPEFGLVLKPVVANNSKKGA